ncbi:MAG TPA: fatty acyl-AMP ligase [Vicinamibacterales bacterium]|jgi:fatty-acyl-CoA synthase
MSRLRTLPQALAEAARAGCGYTFVHSAAGGASPDPSIETFRSYADIQTRAQRIARSLRESGLRRGDLVALVLPDAEQFLTAFFGASMASLVPASLFAPSATTELRRYFDLTANALRSSGASAVVTTPGLRHELEALRATCPALSLVLTWESLDAPAAEIDAPPGLDDIAFVQFTSGSTSAPKGIVLSHRNVAANVDAINGPSGLAIGVDDVAVGWLPLSHDMGLVGLGLGPLYAASHGVFLPPHLFARRPVEWLRALTRHRGTISFSPNFGYDLCVRRVKDRELDGLDLSAWRIAGCGAEPIHAQTLEAFAERFARSGFRRTSLFPSYGLAEHVLAASFSPRGRGARSEVVAEEGLEHERVARPACDGSAGITLVSCGRPFPGHEIRILNEDGQPLPERSIGEIVLSGPSVMLGYYKHDALTRQTVRDGWLRTGDLGYLAGGELFVCGRAKDVIIVHGRKYHPQDLEWAVDDLAGVRRGRVVAFGTTEAGRPDRVVIVAEPNGTVAAETLQQAIRQQVSDLFGLYVDEVALVPSGTVGRTTSGKVRRSETRARYEGLRAEG